MNSIDTCIEMLRLIEVGSRKNESARKEILVSYLRSIFPQPEYQSAINGIAGGAEEHLRTLPSTHSGSTHGFMDTRNGKLIIEFKENLLQSSSLSTAEIELKRYVASIWSSDGVDSAYCCIATDVLNWRIYRPIPKEIAENGIYSSDDVDIELVEECKATYSDRGKAEHLLLLLDRVLFKENLQVLTAESLKTNFGLLSSQYQLYKEQIKNIVLSAQGDSEVALAIDLWSNFQDYNSRNVTGSRIEIYSSQLYLVMLVRLMVAALFAKQSSDDDQMLAAVINGNYFRHNLRLTNFVERDFFGWISDDPWLEKAMPVARQIFHSLKSYDFSASSKDNIIRLIYDELMPDEHSSMLGQRSTPKSLVDPIVRCAIAQVDNDFYFLDPACGSGNFLFSVINELKLQLKSKGSSDSSTLLNIAARVQGIDVDPVAVILAKSMWVLAVSDILHKTQAEISIPIYHADSLFVAGKEAGNDESNASIYFDNTTINVPEGLFSAVGIFDTAVYWCNRRAKFLSGESVGLSHVREVERGDVEQYVVKLLAEYSGANVDKVELVDFVTSLTNQLAQRMFENRNGIWSFIIRNSYRPTLFAGKFDLIATNPPWLAMSSIPDVPYKDELKNLAAYFGINPRGSSSHHVEIATTFVLRSVSHFLKDGGVSAFVMPRSIFDGDQHAPFRDKKYAEKVDYSIHEVWDLEGVEGLFRVPSCVMFGVKTPASSVPKYKILQNKEFVIESNQPVFEDKYSLEISYLGAKSAWHGSLVMEDSSPLEYAYSSLFKQGADLMPRTAIFVDIVSKVDGDTVTITTSEQERLNKNNKKLIGTVFTGVVNKDFLFRAITSNSLLPYYIDQQLISEACLPITMSQGHIEILGQNDLYKLGDLDTAEWFLKIDQQLGEKKLRDLVNVRGKLTQQNFYKTQYIVLYGAGGSRPCAALYKNDLGDTRKIIIDQTLYGYAARSLEEGYYLVGIINSAAISSKIMKFQSRGDFGERHVHKLPLSLIPKFDASNPTHQNISVMAKELEKEAETVQLNNGTLAQRRIRVRGALMHHEGELNRLVGELLA